MEYAKFKGLSKGAHHVSKAILSSLGMQLKYYVQIHYKSPHFFSKENSFQLIIFSMSLALMPVRHNQTI